MPNQDVSGTSLSINMVCLSRAAYLHDGSQGLELLWQLDRFPHIKLLCLDSAYQSEFEKAAELYGFKIEISQKPQSSLGLVPQKGRWQVERSFS
ncbi:MAG: hypothetical protein AAF944_08495 [Bacteroidota bacterium]